MGSIHDRVNVGVGVIVYDPRTASVLLGKRLGKHGAGEYSLPGGKPDPGESPSEAASRELWEETGIHIEPGLMSRVGYWSYDVFEDAEMHFVTLYFIALMPFEQIPMNIEPDKCEGWEFHPIDNLPRPLFCGTEGAIQTVLRNWQGRP